MRTDEDSLTTQGGGIVCSLEKQQPYLRGKKASLPPKDTLNQKHREGRYLKDPGACLGWRFLVFGCFVLFCFSHQLYSLHLILSQINKTRENQSPTLSRSPFNFFPALLFLRCPWWSHCSFWPLYAASFKHIKVQKKHFLWAFCLLIWLDFDISFIL